ncbi:carboxymuconolactone decarboxylase family protein [Leucobacter sp. UCMA 4100]|uniref:carboxymuconolactone decarboxylase family protein n=1 Tax=Leucobacter sp. UCMA 4100 TaxID=2810534 RepID=UPI0022EA6253|nr:carboxymuconolactone decarboxylase family protein [Leucobacter sp. UCMA 4100]MDA3147162.1 carboxymuconolactone decarboxylase family protein [Leucobacter sp. UCMA 4100]
MRLAISHHAPEGYKAVAALDGYVSRNLDPILLDVVKLRASQLNGCAFCVDIHATDLEKHGVPTRKIFAVNVWQETNFFTEEERAALALTEQITHVFDGIDGDVWREASEVFNERELSDLVLAIGTINLWNRIGVSTHLAPPPLEY